MYNPFSLQGKTVLVTGASSGIGRTTAEECAKMGATVYATARNEQRLRDVVERLDTSFGQQHQMILADLTANGGIAKVVDGVPALDGVASNAGIVVGLVPIKFLKDDVIQHAFETNNFPIANGAELPLSTMNDTKITVQYGDSTDWDIKVADAIVDKKNRDIPVSNGIIHAVHNVVAPDNNSLAQYLTNILGGRKEGFHVAALMVEAAGLMDTLSKVRDDVYEKLYQEGRIPDYTSQYGYTYDTNACAPEHRYYGFSFFAETDEFWSNAIGKPALEITLDDVMEYLEGQGVYPDATRDKNYTQENNLLNRFITYHIIPARLTPDRLIYHYNEMGYNHTTGNLGVAMSEFYVTLGKRRLLKIYESRDKGITWKTNNAFTLPSELTAYHLSAATDDNGYLWIKSLDDNSVWRGFLIE